MRKARLFIAGLATSAAIAAVAACAQNTPPDGVVIPFPEEGRQYRMSEVCQHLQGQGYEVKGTLTHEFGPEAFEDLLENIPSLARKPLENYLDDGIRVEVEIRSLCEALNE